MFLSGLNWILVAIAAVALVVAWLSIGRGLAFICTAVTWLAVCLGIFIRMLPGLGFVDAGTRTVFDASGELMGLNLFSAGNDGAGNAKMRCSVDTVRR